MAHTITAQVVGEFGLYQSVAQTVNVSALSDVAEAGVNWSKLAFTVGENLTGKIAARDATGAPPSSILWTLYRNGCAVYSAQGANIDFTGTQIGTYRLKGIAYCTDGTQLSFDSTVFVQGAVTVRHTLPVPDEGGTLVYLGAVYSQNIIGSAGKATSLPYKTASATEDIFLLPGTTHWMFDLDPTTSAVDDEVMVRTKKGNWCLNGLAGGLSGEAVGYDYGYMPTVIPAPFDHRINLTVEMFKVHGINFNSFDSRVRVKCYRRLPGGIYQYTRCTYSSFPGGEGRRTRRWAALFTNMDVQNDVASGGRNRAGTGTSVIPYTTVDVTSVPLTTLTTSGAPNPVQGYTGLFFTDSNLYAYYEAYGQRDLAANAISAIERVRPCCISLLTFDGKPVMSSRVKRLYGKMTLFLTDGAVFEGSVLSVRVYRTDSLAYDTFTVPITATSYVNEDSTILKIAEVDVDLNDFQFDETGVVVDFLVDESAAILSPLPNPVPTPYVGPDYIYSPVFSHTVTYDGACYTNPVYVPTLDDNAVMVTPIGGCQDPSCGPNALYCYTALNPPAENIIVPQPFGMPSPYVAFGSNPARCFYNPVISLALVTGTEVSTLEFFGSQRVDLWAYSGTALCGSSYLYDDCQRAYAPCGAHSCSLIVVYPVSASPHATVEYGGRCYSYAGSTNAYGTYSVVSAGSVNPVVGCHDPACVDYNASGSVVVYNDTQTFLEVPVRFDNLDRGIAQYGAAPQVIDNGFNGLVEGSKTLQWWTEPDALVYTAGGAGTLMLNFGLSGIRKQVVVYHAGSPQVYNTGLGSTRQKITVAAGDSVYIRVADAYGRLPLQYRGLHTIATWQMILFLPRLFDTVVVPYTGNTSINALGFCAYTDDGPYTFYGSLPFYGSMTGPVNPDSIVTVTSATSSQEYVLVAARAQGDITMTTLQSAGPYAGQLLDGPLTFRFYAAREAFGAHGEMDVWFNTNGTFPAYFKAGAYDSLKLSGTYYRKNSTPTDTLRNSYAVATSASSWPGVYVGYDGEVLSVQSSAGTVAYNGKVFSNTGTYDPGLSATIIPAGAV